QDLPADDQPVGGLSGPDQSVGQVQGVEEADARRRDVGRRGPSRADVALHETGGRRKGHVPRDRADQDHVEVLGLDVGALQGQLGGARAQVREVLPVGCDVPLPDAGPGGDPLVRGLDQFLEIGVGEDLFRNGSARPNDLGAVHRLESYALRRLFSRAWSSAICAWIKSARRRLENSAANLMAFLTALAEERPWQMITQPFTPSSGAPP